MFIVKIKGSQFIMFIEMHLEFLQVDIKDGIRK